MLSARSLRNIRLFSTLQKAMEQKLQAAFSPEVLEVLDQSGGQESHFQIVVVSQQFKGVLPLQRHRMINDCLKEEVPKIHAMQIEAKSPDQLK